MKSYFRFLWRNKSLTVIQVLGISIALSFAIPAVSLLLELQSMNRDNPQYRNIYGVGTSATMSFEGEDQHFLDNYPEVEAATMFVSSGTMTSSDILINNDRHKAATMYCNPDIEDFFPFEMVSGSIESLKEGNSIILSKEFAGSLSDEDLLGSTVFIKDKAYVVKGILDSFKSKRIPETDIILSMDECESYFWSYTFIRLREGTDIEEFTDKVKNNDTEMFASKLNVTENYIKLRFVRYDKLAESGDFYWLTTVPSEMMLILGLSLLLLLLFAFSNYTNLSMAMSTRRAREMATKRLLGSSKAEIRRQVILENIVFTAICFAIGMLFATYSTNIFHEFINIDHKCLLLSGIEFGPASWPAYLLLILAVGVLTGVAPARAISRYSALDVVKGEFKAKEKRFISKALIVIQGVITVSLLFLTILERGQINHNSKLDIGCDIDDVLFIKLPSSDDTEKDAVLQALLQKPYVSVAGYSESLPGNCMNPVQLSGETALQSFGPGKIIKPAGAGDTKINLLICDEAAFEALGFRTVEDHLASGRNTLWISQSLKERLEERSLTGEEMITLGADAIGGVIETFLASRSFISGMSPEDMIGFPSVEVRSGGSAVKKNYMVLRTVGDHSELIKDIRSTIDEVIYSHSGRLKDRSGSYMRDFLMDTSNVRATIVLLNLMKKYLLIMIILSILGILGISTYNMQIRRHDMAVRKVFGSTTLSESVRNAGSYSVLMLIANVIGLPIGYIIGTRLLQNEISKVAIAPWMYLVTFLFTMGVVICVCLIQSYFTANINPVDNLKSE